MPRKYNDRLLLLSLTILVQPLPSLSNNATCPYNIDAASRLIPAACYANTTAPSATSCCWFVFAAYIYAAACHANLTGAAFLPPDAASACSTAFSATLIRRGLVRAALLRSDNTCSLSGDPGSLSAGNRPCQYSTVAAILSTVDLANATLLCDSPAVDLSNNQTSCGSCQDAVISAVFSLFDSTGSKEFVPCGMAVTVAIWSSSFPKLDRFESYALCMVQILENVGNLGTGNLIPPSPAAPRRVHKPVASSRSVAIAAGSAAAALASIAAIACLILAIRRRRRVSNTFTGDRPDPDPTAEIRAPKLPTEGMYIFTKEELKQATDGYDERRLLGQGGAGKVYLGKLPSGQHVAIKRIYRERKLGEFYREVEILAKLRHRNLTTLVGYCAAGGGRKLHALVYEYMDGGNLAAALHDGELTWRQRLRIAVDVAEGLLYLHEFAEGAVVHRDVKPTNVLLTGGAAEAVAKLSDLGVSRIVPAEVTHVSTEVRGTMGYMDPDSFPTGRLSEAADVYSFGVVLLELVTGMRAVVATPSGGAESIVHVARGAFTTAAVGSIVDPRLGPEWDRASVGAVFDAACRCVRPYKDQRPATAEVLAVLKQVMADLEGGSGDVVPSPPSTDFVSAEFTDLSTSTRRSTPSASAHQWSS